MKKLRNCFTCFFLMLLGVAAAFGQDSSPQPSAKSTPPEPKKTPVSSRDSQENEYRIGFQDLLDIQIFRLPDYNQTVTVSSQGTIALFRLEQPIVAVCRTSRELADDIAKAYIEAKLLRNPQVNLMVREQKSQSFAVIGAVEKPGNYYISRRVHLLELLAFAGGPNKEAGTRILVARAGSKSSCQQTPTFSENSPISIMDFRLREVQEGKQTLWMQAGDVVSVLDADIVYMYGSLNKPGPVKIREPITLRQAISSAEGITKTAATDKIRILRRVPGKLDPEEFVFDLGLINKGKLKDPFLEPNDIVAVSQDTTKVIYHGIIETVKTAVPSAIYAIP